MLSQISTTVRPGSWDYTVLEHSYGSESAQRLNGTTPYCSCFAMGTPSDAARLACAIKNITANVTTASTSCKDEQVR